MLYITPLLDQILTLLFYIGIIDELKTIKRKGVHFHIKDLYILLYMGCGTAFKADHQPKYTTGNTIDILYYKLYSTLLQNIVCRVLRMRRHLILPT